MPNDLISTASSVVPTTSVAATTASLTTQTSVVGSRSVSSHGPAGFSTDTPGSSGPSVFTSQGTNGPPVFATAASNVINAPQASVDDPLGLKRLPPSGSFIPGYPTVAANPPRVNLPPFALCRPPGGKENVPVYTG